MRATAIVSEYLCYIPGAVLFLRSYARLSGIPTWEYNIALTAFLLQPATILIDHGHFQYNTVMLGFTLASLFCMLTSSPVWSCFFFVGALGFKQMALFYAPAVFAYLLGICTFPRLDIPRFLHIALITALSFALLFAPLLLGSLYDSYRGHSYSAANLPAPPLLGSLLSIIPIHIDQNSLLYPPLLQLAQSIHRIFPFARGLFEDKVANLWCALHTFHKLHTYPPTLIQRAALLATLAAITPPCLILFLRPRKPLLPYAFAATAWAFFLCSYQVHEKNVLLPLLPMTLLLGGEGGLLPSTRAWVGFANLLACFTLFPLLKRDELRVPYFVLTLLWAWLLGLPPASLSAYVGGTAGNDTAIVGRGHAALGGPVKLLHGMFYVAVVVWHVGEAVVPVPVRGKPDLWVVGNVLVGAAGFGVCYLWCLWRLVVGSGLLDGKVGRGGGVEEERSRDADRKKVL